MGGTSGELVQSQAITASPLRGETFSLIVGWLEQSVVEAPLLVGPEITTRLAPAVVMARPCAR